MPFEAHVTRDGGPRWQRGAGARTLDRLFPLAPTDQEAWPTMLWATGRGDLPGRDRLGEWRWDSTVR